jgi:hypothetical protein
MTLQHSRLVGAKELLQFELVDLLHRDGWSLVASATATGRAATVGAVDQGRRVCGRKGLSPAYEQLAATDRKSASRRLHCCIMVVDPTAQEVT